MSLVFDEDDVGKLIRNTTDGVPHGLNPDVPGTSDEFIKSRQLCNAEMMWRTVALCTEKTRKAYHSNPEDYIPYIMRAQSRRNLKKILENTSVP